MDIQMFILIRILAADLLTGLAPGIAGTLFFFFFIRVKQFTFVESSGLLLIYFLAAVFGTALAGGVAGAVIARRAGRARRSRDRPVHNWGPRVPLRLL